VIVSNETLQAKSKLVQIANTLNLLGLSFGVGKRWEQQRSQNADDGEDNEQLN